MKCPVCQATLLPVDGELFCLQCGNVVEPPPGAPAEGPVLEETSDPVLQRAIVDAARHEVHFKLPVSAAPSRPVTSFASMRAMLTPPRPAVAAGGATAVVAPPPGASMISTPAPPAALAVMAPIDPAGTGTRHRYLSVAWMLGAAVFALFVGVNGALYLHYSDRVYPGVKVGNRVVGEMPLSELHETVRGLVKQPRLTLQAGNASYQVNTVGVGSADVDRLEQEIRDVGRTTPLPMAGVLASILSKPVEVHYVVNDAGLRKVAAGLEQEIDRPSSDAVPLIVNGRAFVITEKAGAKVESAKLTAAIRDNFGHKENASINLEKSEPLVTAGSYKADIEEARARLALNLQVKVKNVSYTPTSAQIGSWLVFAGSGKGVVVDGAGVAGFVAAIPGKFDRLAATNAVIGAVGAKQSLSYVAQTKKNVAAPALPSAVAGLPRVTYGYCLAADPTGDEMALTQQASAVLADPAGWAMGGAVRFVAVKSGCNFTINLVSPANMAKLDAKCADQTTCQSGSVAAISTATWTAAPAAWAGTLEAYRGELINHEVGHWLGFDHTSCLSQVKAPVSQEPAVTVAGCSPNWYAVPVELQGTKILAGF
jgi:hypothetical protein